MTKHFNVGEAKAQLSKLIAAAKRGEEVFIDHAGVPVARLIAVEDSKKAELQRIGEKRRKAFGMWRDAFKDWPDEKWMGPSMTDEEVEERWVRKFGPAA